MEEGKWGLGVGVDLVSMVSRFEIPWMTISIHGISIFEIPWIFKKHHRPRFHGRGQFLKIKLILFLKIIF